MSVDGRALNQEVEDRMEREKDVLPVLMEGYISIFEVDLERDWYEILKAPATTAAMRGEERIWSRRLGEDFASECSEDTREVVRNVSDAAFLRRELQETPCREYFYRFWEKGGFSWRRCCVRALTWRGRVPTSALVTFSAMSETVSAMLEEARKRSHGEARENRILSAITKMLYGFNLTIDLATGRYTAIAGTGMEGAMRLIGATDDYRTLHAVLMDRVMPAFREQYHQTVALDYLRNSSDYSGFIARCEFSVDLDGIERRAEVNVFMDHDADGRAVANVLGRDVTDAWRAEAARKAEVEAADAKNQLLAGITQTLYGFNITVDLQHDTYTYIEGSGAAAVVEILRRGGAYSRMLDVILEAAEQPVGRQARTLLGIDYLLGRREAKGFLGTVEVPLAVDGRTCWYELNVFMSVSATGAPVANLLGRDITEAHERSARREREVRVAAAKDQILAEITKQLYGYNASVNLRTMTYSVIRGTGMDDVCSVLNRHESFPDAYDAYLKLVAPAYRIQLEKLISPGALRRLRARGSVGPAGTVEILVERDGAQHWHETNLFVGLNDEGDVMANILGRDVTAIHARTEAALEAERQNTRARNFFFSTVSHDIRTPLNSIIGFAELLKSEKDPVRRGEYLDNIGFSGSTLLELINDVLDLAKLDVANVEMNCRPFDMARMMRLTLRTFETTAHAKGLRIEEDVADMPLLNLDERRMRQVIFNLLGNAVKYTDRGGVKLSARFVATSDGTGELRFSVSDTGIGIASADISKLMEPFVRIESVANARGGTGLGLAICKRIVEIAGGRISISSVPGEGATFSVVIPSVAFSAEAKSPVPSAAVPLRREVDLSSLKVLVVDDLEMNRTVLCGHCRNLGVGAVEEAASGVDALAMLAAALAEKPFSVVLCDMKMPGMSGADVVRAIRAKPDLVDLPVYLVTADVEALKYCRELGADGVLLKPVVGSRLSEILVNCDVIPIKSSAGKRSG